MKSFSKFKEHESRSKEEAPEPIQETAVVERYSPLGFGLKQFQLDEAPLGPVSYDGDDEAFALEIASRLDDGISSINAAIELDNRRGKTNNAKVGVFAIMPDAQRIKWSDLANQIIADSDDLESATIPDGRKEKDVSVKHKDMDRYVYINCRPDGKRSKAGDDPNELMTAALCLKNSLTAPKTVEEMDELIKFVQLNLSKVRGATQGQINSLEGDYVNLCSAVSAALTLHKNKYGNADMVYLTGQSWDQDVKQFQITKYGMKDFNSSDFIVKKGSSFLGVSLKKKKLYSTKDPTLINKSFSTLFQDSKFNKMMAELDKRSAQFYLRVLAVAKQKKIASPKLLADMEKTRPNAKNWKKFIQRIPNDLVNSQLKGNKSLFRSMSMIILKNKELMANQLIQLIFKADLKDLKKVNFDFTLVTGIGDYGPRKGVDVKIGDYKDIDTVSTKLNEIVKNEKITIRETPGAVQAFSEGATAATLKFDLMIGKLPVCHIELRYKGNFRSAPSFTATMTDEFKSLYK